MNEPIPVWHYDGQSAVRREVFLFPEGRGFRLQGAMPQDTLIKWDELVYRDQREGDLLYGLKGRTGWQIGLSAERAVELGALLPQATKYGGLIDRLGLAPAVVVLLGVSTAGILAVMALPQIVAPLIPMSWEKKLGDAMVGDLGGRICNTPESRRAMDAMIARLKPEGVDIRVDIANISMVNAVALPGGRIVLFKQLIQEAKSPDELAGVIGHEIGHVRHRDVMQSLLRQLGLSLVLGGANSNAAGAVNTLISSGYSREAESDADDYSIKLMQQSRVTPYPTADFFARLAEDEKMLGKASTIINYVNSHPLSSNREKVFRSSVRKGASYTPVISPEQWLAITQACTKDPHVKSDDGLIL